MFGSSEKIPESILALWDCCKSDKLCLKLLPFTLFYIRVQVYKIEKHLKLNLQLVYKILSCV